MAGDALTTQQAGGNERLPRGGPISYLAIGRDDPGWVERLELGVWGHSQGDERAPWSQEPRLFHHPLRGATSQPPRTEHPEAWEQRVWLWERQATFGPGGRHLASDSAVRRPGLQSLRSSFTARGTMPRKVVMAKHRVASRGGAPEGANGELGLRLTRLACGKLDLVSPIKLA